TAVRIRVTRIAITVAVRVVAVPGVVAERIVRVIPKPVPSPDPTRPAVIPGVVIDETVVPAKPGRSEWIPPRERGAVHRERQGVDGDRLARRRDADCGTSVARPAERDVVAARRRTRRRSGAGTAGTA